jgi:Lipocalin-like domain
MVSGRVLKITRWLIVWASNFFCIKPLSCKALQLPRSNNGRFIGFRRYAQNARENASDNDVTHGSPLFPVKYQNEVILLTASRRCLRIEGDKVIHHVLTAWFPTWIGTDQVRYFKIDGKTLTITTAPITSGENGRQLVSTLAFERVE